MGVVVENYDSLINKEKYQDISKKFVITNSSNDSVSVITYGALITELNVLDKEGSSADIMLGLRDLDAYMVDCSNHGSIVGRSANRISSACFDIDGVLYTVPANDAPNNIHSGSVAYQSVFWDGKVISEADIKTMIHDSSIEGLSADVDGDGVLFNYVSPDGCEGFPGNIDTTVVYAWLKDRTLLILYKATTDKATIFAPTNHAYFNLGGHNVGIVDDNILQIDADQVTLKDSHNCPDGTYMDVSSSIFDFKTGAPVKQALVVNHPQTSACLGIDQNFCLKNDGKYMKVASLKDNRSSREMEVLTDLPGLQIYAGNHLGGNLQKGDILYKPYYGICLEAQMYPNAINVPSFESPIIRPGETKYHACGYRFVNQ